jgi:protein-tyrosine-phosphatase/DNA-binding transcriptional ArsR family regulator
MSATEPPEVLSLLAEPLRWRLVAHLRESDRRVGELVELLDRPQNLVSYHLAELKRADLVRARRSSADGRDIYYQVDAARCRELLVAAGSVLHPGSGTSLGPPTGATTRRPKHRILFLCTGNSARSQIAEALVEHHSSGAVLARSAGSHPKTLHPNAVRVMAARGIDISSRRTKPLTDFTGRRFDRVITLCDKVREICPEFPGPAVTAHWSMPDPAASAGDDTDTYPAFERAAGEIEGRVTLLLADLAATSASNRTHHDRKQQR